MPSFPSSPFTLPHTAPRSGFLLSVAPRVIDGNEEQTQTCFRIQSCLVLTGGDNLLLVLTGSLYGCRNRDRADEGNKEYL